MMKSPVNSKLIKLEREINAIANQVRGKTKRSRAFRRKGLKLIRLSKLIKQKLAAIAAFCRKRGIAIAALIRGFINVAIRGASVSVRARSKQLIPALERPASPNRRASEKVEKVAVILVCACLGLVSVCAVVGVVLLVQIREMKTDMAQMGYQFAATRARVNQLETAVHQIDNEQSEAASNRNVAKAQPKQPPLALGSADIQIVRQYIIVTPPPPGVQGKLNVGDDIGQLTASPIPFSLADALPKLRGASFSIDQDGSIIIIGAKSNRIDAVIPYR